MTIDWLDHSRHLRGVLAACPTDAPLHRLRVQRLVITIRPVSRALIPVDSAAASRVSAPNYDEFQGDAEIRKVIARNPDSVLRVTMAHCDVPSGQPALPEGSKEALEHAGAVMSALVHDPLTREVTDVLWVYEIVDPARPGVRQIGLGGMGLLDEIRTADNTAGTIIRNEGVRPPKAQGRADLIAATNAIVGTVNNAVDDLGGALDAELRRLADAAEPDLTVTDHHENEHRIWLVEDPADIARLQRLMAAQSHAYVADGNHRSAAAALLGHEEFLTVFFPTATMGIRPYNRLVRANVDVSEDVVGTLGKAFEVTPLPDVEIVQPEETHQIGLYVDGMWYLLVPRAGTFDPANAAEDIDADIVQRHLFDAVLGIGDPRDDRLRFVGSNKDAAYLRAEVDRGGYTAAVTLPPVTMDQFVRVCLQDRMMPPKSTWFEPKIRSGLVMALL